MSAWHSSLFTGLFTRFGPISPRPYDPACTLCNGLAASWFGHAEGVPGSGIGWDEASAEGACVGEAIERLQAASLPDDVLLRASFDAWPLREPAIDPAKWVLFHPEQYRQPGFPFQPLTRETVCSWVCFRQALTGTPHWLPAEIAYLDLPDGHRFCPGYSTGLAAGRTGEPILLRALQEVIERDAVIGAWWGRYPIEEFSLSAALDGVAPEIRGQMARPNLAYRCFRIATPFSDHVTMVTLEGDDREGYCFSIGSSCRETRSASWLKSLLEAIHGRHYVRYLKTQVAAGMLKVGRCPTSFAEHAVYYSMVPQDFRRTVLGNLPAKPKNKRSDSWGSAVPDTIAYLIERLGPERPVLFRSMTPPALASENLGWHVSRVVVPGLQPMHGHHGLPHLGGPLWLPRGGADWRTMPPHPFP